ncbi:hypothetical protein KEM56_003118, partial [Ascosphaera pollenicola]
VSASHVKKLLDSRNDREKLEGLRTVIAYMYCGESTLPFFSAIVKNVADPNIEIKKLVYLYLLHHAEAEPDLALLSINAIQKSLTDQNPLVRAMALRTMSGIKVPVISQIVSLAIKRGCGDMSPQVRKASALAIPKCYRLDPSTLPIMLEVLSSLLGDNQYYVVGPALQAFLEICPERIDLLHKHYRSIVRKLVDMDEWSQVATMRLLTPYARRCFPRRTQQTEATAQKSFYDDDDTDNNVMITESPVLDPDLESFLNACRQLLQSRNSAVVINAVRCILYLGTKDQLQVVVGPLIALLRGPQDTEQIALYNMIRVALVDPKLFVRYITHMLLRAADVPAVWRLKLEILTLLFSHCGQHFKGIILSELEHFSASSDPELVRECVRAIGRCAQGDASASSRCMSILLRQISSADENLVSEALTVIRHLIQQDSPSHRNTVIMLAKHLDTTTSPEARASIIWLVGEHARIDSKMNIAPDVLRILVKGFAKEHVIVKQQIVLLGAKVYLQHLLDTPHPQPQESPAGQENEGFDEHSTESSRQEDTIDVLWRYILLLSRYDISYDLRDRARLYKSLLAVPTSTELAQLLLHASKPVPHTPTPSETRRDLLLGSTTLIVGSDSGVHGLKGYEPMPEWVEPGQEPDPSLREEERPATMASSRGSTSSPVTAGERLDRALQEHQAAEGPSSRGTLARNMKNMTLDDWLAESESEETDDDEEGEEGEEEESSEEESEEESSEEESDDESDDVGKNESANLVKK